MSSHRKDPPQVGPVDRKQVFALPLTRLRWKSDDPADVHSAPARPPVTIKAAAAGKPDNLAAGPSARPAGDTVDYVYVEAEGPPVMPNDPATFDPTHHNPEGDGE